MKPVPVLIAVSLLANAVLAGAYFLRPASAGLRSPAATQSTPSVSPEATASSSPVGTKSAPAAAGITAPDGTGPGPGFSWASIETDDLDELMRRLIAAGFSAREARLIVMNRINWRTGSAAGNGKPLPYWQARRTDFSDPKTGAEARKRIAEQQKLFQKYVQGPDAIAADPEIQDAMRARWGNLSVDKLQALAAIEGDYQEMSLQQFIERRSRPGEAMKQQEAYALMEKEKSADIARVLTPEEFAEYELRASPTANALRFSLETFKPTEAEYKAIFAVRNAYTDRLSDPGLTADARKALNAEMQDKITAAIGPDRALDYDAAVNNNSQDQTARLISRLNLPARVAVEVRRTQTDFTQRAKDLRANQALSAADRDAQLSALYQQASALLMTKLGADGFEAYSDVKGEWLRNLKPKR